MFIYLSKYKQMTKAKWLLLHTNTCSYLTANEWKVINRIIRIRSKYLKLFNCVPEKMSLGSSKRIINKMFLKIMYT